MPLRLTPAIRNAAVNAAVAIADSGTAEAVLSIYTGTQPASAEDAPTGTLLVTFTLNDPAYGPSIDGTSSLNTGGGISSVAVDSGIAAWGRLTTSEDETVYDGVCASTGTPEFLLNSISITSGQVILLNAGSLSVPSGE